MLKKTLINPLDIDSMKALVCHTFGSPKEVLVIEERNSPRPAKGQVVIDVKAACVTYVDALMVQDKYQFTMPLPYIPGGEVAGIVSAVGNSVENVTVGDRVVSASLSGGFAEQVLVNASDCQSIPDTADFGGMLGRLYTYGTAYYALHVRAQLKANETLLILGSASSVGLAGIEVAKLMGARVIAAASSEEKLALCRQYGADETINYSKEDLKEQAKILTSGQGVDVVYDVVGGEYSEQALRAIAWNGRFLVIGFNAGIAKLPLNLALLKGCQIVGVFFGNLPTMEPETMDLVAGEVNRLMAEGQLKPGISKSYSLEEAPDALNDFIERRVIGRVVITP